ncbi:hypothetical protein N9A94_05815 [Akkermansiaceae bacterium]|nr:hypothetical protein [Akkermansiaceae bacterium]MDB4544461.1 hypothetical protein [Akkermansiaceae bacterium]
MIKKAVILSLAVSTLSLRAAPDTVDTTFAATAGQVFDAGAYGGISSIYVQPDGKILFGSNEMPGDVGGPRQMSLIRVNPDGTIDSHFSSDSDPNGAGTGIQYIGSGWPEVHALGMQSDQKIIAAGVMTGMNDGTTSFNSSSIVRINPDGTVDNTLQTGGSVP